jgi:hypothetical protein
LHRIHCTAGVIGALTTMIVAFDANAFSISPVPNQSYNVTLVAGGCGLGFHRGPYGGCRPNIAGYPVVGYGGGVYRGGVYRGGAYRGGVYRGGVYRGGVYRGGVYRGGVYHRGGVYRRGGGFHGGRGGFRGGFHGGRGGFHGGRGGFRGGGRGGGRRSDFRLKHEIILLGHLNNGLGFYRFVYNGGEKAYVGVIAQEVQRVIPQAVVRGRDGYLRVYYDKAGLKFQTYDRWIASGARVPPLP